ncbi:hypothetical protein PG994_006826 [Apiospora phragmitis]|uniref:Uncharacterized protein n=1 Tax=Apiospora phragmitis TaxID=2905665 RepID=A0ABR1VG63_9PEZI
MRDFIVFESLGSVLDVFWDILIVCVVVKVGLLYALATFATWEAIEYWAERYLLLNTSLTHSQWDIFLLLARVASTLVWARLFVRHYELPRVRWFRLAIGCVCLLFTVAAESMVVLFLHRHYDGLLWSTPAETKIAYGTLLASYCLVPFALLGKNTDATKKEKKGTQAASRKQKDVGPQV